MKIRESGENYLETIYMLRQKKEDVRSVDVAACLNYSKPSVSRAMGILKGEGYITIDKSGCINFTQRGLKKAENVYFRHGVIKDFFMQVLGIDETIAETDACRIEHVISEEIILGMKQCLQTKK